MALSRPLVPSPRKRGPDKVVLSTYIPPDVSQLLREAVAEDGSTVAAFVTAALEQHLSMRGVYPPHEAFEPTADLEAPPQVPEELEPPCAPPEGLQCALSPVEPVRSGEPVQLPLDVLAEPVAEPVVHKPTLAERALAPRPDLTPVAPPATRRPPLAERFRLQAAVPSKS